MTRALTHRGPDSEGFYEEGSVHFGHRRLKIIDLETGAQPIENEDGTVVVVFNGEIYNFQELRKNLEAKGHRFKTQSDTECIVHLYEEEGLAFANHLRGQFAIALWDKAAHRLVLTRDRMGQKPVYYSDSSAGLCFASELSALTQHPSVNRTIDPNAIQAFLTLKYIPEPQTIFRDVYKLPPAHLLIHEQGRTRVEPYWSADFDSKLEIGEDEAIAELDRLLNEAVRLRMISDVPLGAFLSGGIDSSLIVAYMARNSDRPVKTFTIGFDDVAKDEREYARQVAKRFKTEHHEFVVNASAANVLPTMVRHFGEPFADSSALPTYYISKVTRDHVTVALNGDGGDESFAGYRRYEDLKRVESFKCLPQIMQSTLLGVAGIAPGFLGDRAARARRWSRELRKPLALVYQRAMSMNPQLRDRLLSGDLRKQLTHDETWIAERFPNGSERNAIDAVLAADQSTYLPGDLLVKIDRMTMLHSLEGRSPFLDHKLVEFAASLPDTLKLHPTAGGKHLLKQLLLRDFDLSFVNRRKMGFGIPLDRWLREGLRPLLYDCLSQSRASEYGLLEQSMLIELADAHCVQQESHGDLLWSLLNLELWFREVYENQPHPVTQPHGITTN